MNSDTLLELNSATNKCKKDKDIKAVILTGAGDKAFVAGADIMEAKDKAPKEMMEFAEFAHNILRLMEAMGKPVIAAVNGFALGGGTEIAIACDVRFASDKARFGQPEILLGIIPGWGATQRLARLIGMGRAKELVLSDEQITAQRAYEIGLVNRVFPVDQLMGETKKFAQKLAGMPPFAIKTAKNVIDYVTI